MDKITTTAAYPVENKREIKRILTSNDSVDLFIEKYC